MTTHVTLLVVLTVSLHLAAPTVASAFQCVGGVKNGVVEPGEECDGGPLDSCCKDNCRWRAVGGDCVDPSNVCQKGNCRADHTCDLSSPAAVKGHPTCYSAVNPCLEGECYDKNCVPIGNQPDQWAPRCKPDTDLCHKDECIVTTGGVFQECRRTTPEDAGTNCSTASGATCTVRTCNGTGVCESTGETVECAGSLGVCQQWQCNPGSLSCSQAPVTVGTSCDTNEWDCFERKCTSSGTCGNQERGNGLRCDPDAPPDAEHCFLGTCTGSTCVFPTNVPPGVVQYDDPMTPPLCPSDGNSCTSDECNGNGACRNAALANGTACDNGNSCDTGETCTSGTCGTGTPVANNTLCSDGNPCTKNDVCMGGSCYGPEPTSCDDGDPCTLDACANPGGCSHTSSACAFSLTAEIPNPAATADDFGTSLAVLGTKLVVGAPNFADTHPGTAYLYDPAAPAAPERTFLDPAPAGTTDHLGFSVAALGTDKIIAGAPRSGTASKGAALVFDAGTGSLLNRFESSGSVRGWPIPNQYPPMSVDNTCGAAVAAIAGDVLMGCPGEMRVYRFETTGGTIVHEYENPDDGYSGAIGGSIGVLGNRIAAGTGRILRYGFTSRQVDFMGFMIFNADTEAVVMPAFPNNLPGESITPLGTTFLIGGWNELWGIPMPNEFQDRIALVEASTGAVKYALNAPGGQYGSGWAAAGTLGALGILGRPRQGGDIATVKPNGNDLEFLQSITSPEAGANDQFGSAVAAIGGTIYVGAPGVANSNGGTGAVYAFRQLCGNGAVDVGEQCDDGNSKDGDCCSSTCQHESVGSPCDDNNKCTISSCDGAGACTATGCQPNGLKCGNSCGTILYCQTSGSSCLCQ